MAAGGVRYSIDRDDRIASVDDAWSAFATANGAPELDGARVAGQSIWSFVNGIELRHLYAKIFENVRRERRRLELPFRCDSPGLRRFMEMSISGLDDGSIDIRTTLLSVEERTVATAVTSVLRSMCSWCNRFQQSTSRWIELEEAVVEFDLLAGEGTQLTHGICGECADRVRSKLS